MRAVTGFCVGVVAMILGFLAVAWVSTDELYEGWDSE